jgi:hypothetical protein
VSPVVKIPVTIAEDIYDDVTIVEIILLRCGVGVFFERGPGPPSRMVTASTGAPDFLR